VYSPQLNTGRGQRPDSTPPDPPPHAVPVLEDLLALLNRGGGSSTAICPSPDRAEITRDRLTGDVERFAATATAAARTAPGTSSVWVSARDPYLMLVATLGCLHGHSVALMEAEGPQHGYDTLATVCPPALVVCDVAGADMMRWARATGRRELVIELAAAGNGHRPIGSAGPRGDVLLQFFTSGTTGTPKCVGIGARQLVSAIGWP
jgi:acyl-coenzyme A synthetase/AMP-(fatty) acid ligase